MLSCATCRSGAERRDQRHRVVARRRHCSIVDLSVALRRRPAIALGALVERAMLTGDRLVSAHDVAGHSWWIPADGRVVRCGLPRRLPSIPDRSAWQRPRPGTPPWSRASATGSGGKPCSSSNGAATSRRRRHSMARRSVNAIVLDGRLGHDVPTVVVLGADTMRWGAGRRGTAAWRRALYGDDPAADPSSELEQGRRIARRGRLGGGRCRPRNTAPECGRRVPLLRPDRRGRRLGTVVGRCRVN